LNAKYLKINELILEMMSQKRELRPDCDQVLKDKSWALDMNELEDKFSLLSLTEQSIDESFHKYFIKTKLKFR